MLLPLEFRVEEVNPRLARTDGGATFAEIAHEILNHEVGDLRLFPSEGKDGAIDGSAASPSGRIVVEYKHIGSGGIEAAEGRWDAVARRLDRNLAEDSGPPAGQSQYRPWYGRDNPIAEYWFCTSLSLANQAGRDRLERRISTFFVQLAQRPHLGHLKALRVRVLDWLDLRARSRSIPHTVYRWFPSTRPIGVVPIDEPLPASTFGEFLSRSRLPHYSLRRHRTADTAPVGLAVPDESELLQALADGADDGLLITGEGGVGKSRLTLELGWIALEDGWTVLRALPSADRAAIERLVEDALPGGRIMLLFDYVETRNDFGELAELIGDLNATYFFGLRYVGNCRPAYYSSLAALGRHTRVNLSPAAGDAHQGWQRTYREAAVGHILEHFGFEVAHEHTAVCRDIPVLAVFLGFLKTTGRDVDLRELLGLRDFGAWVARRVRLTLGRDVDRDLALVMTLFPLKETAVGTLDASLRELLDPLSTDGWIERVSLGMAEEVWTTAHDVLADQITTAFLDSIPKTRERFVGEVLETAARALCLDAALASLGRISQSDAFAEIDWVALSEERLAQDADEWRRIRLRLFDSPLLSQAERMRLLESREDLWLLDVERTEFRHRLGALARAIVQDPDGVGVSPNGREVVERWIERAASSVDQNNFLLTWGVRLCGVRIREPALRWLEQHPLEPQTHYLLVAWLGSGLGTEPVRGFVKAWADRFARNMRFNFLARAWLNAGGDPEDIRPTVLAWIEKHGMVENATFVYSAWLTAGGERGAVAPQLTSWLAEHGTSEAAQFVYTAWLDAGGEREVVSSRLGAWVAEHGITEAAQFVYHAWLEAGGEREIVASQLQAWLAEHDTSESAQFVHRAWLDAGGDPGPVTRHVVGWLDQHAKLESASFVFRGWLDAGGSPTVVASAVAAWLEEHGMIESAQFVYRAWLDARGDRELVARHLAAWVREHPTSDAAQYVYRGWLDAGGERDVIEDSLRSWLAELSTLEGVDWVLRAWLEAGGRFDLVRQRTFEWLDENYLHEDACFLMKYVAKEPVVPSDTVRQILSWCIEFPSHEDAIWRLSQVSRHTKHGDVGYDLLRAAESVLPKVMERRLTAMDVNLVTTVCQALIRNGQLRTGDGRRRADVLFLRWLRHPASYGSSNRLPVFLQTTPHFQRIVDLVKEGELDYAGADHAALAEFASWVAGWERGRLEQISGPVRFLRSRFPARELWGRIRLPYG